MEIQMEKEKELKKLSEIEGKPVKRGIVPDYIDPVFAREKKILNKENEKKDLKNNKEKGEDKKKIKDGKDKKETKEELKEEKKEEEIKGEVNEESENNKN